MTTHTLNWQARYTHPRITSVQQAFHAPERGLLVITQDGKPRLHTWQRSSDTITPLESAGNIDFGGIMPDGDAIIFHDGTHLIRCNFDGEIPRSLTPNMPAFTPMSLSASLNGQVIGFTALLDDGFRIYTIRDDNAPAMLYKSTAPAFGSLLSYNGDMAVIAVTERKTYGDFSLLAFNLRQSDGSQSVSVLEESAGSIQPVAFAPTNDDLRLLAMTNATGFQRPVIWDTQSGDRVDIPLEHIEDDLTPLGWSPDAEKILLQRVERAVHKLYVYDLKRSTFDPLINLPAGTIHHAGFVPDAPDSLLLLHETAQHPPQIVTVSAKDGALMDTLSQDIATDGYKWRSVEFISSGNVTVQGWLATPQGDAPFPTIIHAPPGPEAVLTESYLADASAWVDAGFAWLGVNYRGSATFGDAFRQAIFGMLGLREADDLIAGATYLISAGIAREDALFVSGERYGGSAGLLALGKRPDLWAGAMVDSPVTDWKALHNSANGALKAHIEAMFGGSPADYAAQYLNSSALTVADNVEAPVMLFGIKDDPNLPETQLTRYAGRLQDNDGNITVVWSTSADDPPLKRQIQRLDWTRAITQKSRAE